MTTFNAYMENINLTNDYMMGTSLTEEEIEKDAYIFEGFDFRMMVKENAIYLVAELDGMFEKVLIEITETTVEPFWMR